MKINIQDTFNVELPADPLLDNNRRQVLKSCFSFVNPTKPSNGQLIHVSKSMLTELGFNSDIIEDRTFEEVFTGTTVYPGSRPYAMCYGGHQFGQWAGQLGDGRAINLFEILHDKKRWQLQLKGAGATPYSRTADGLAVLRSSIREHLCSEAMHALGVPTTRSLSLALTGDQVLRDIMYNGNPAYEQGAVVCRVARTFIRFGNYQIFASRSDHETLKVITDYTIKYFFEGIKGSGKDAYLEFFRQVVDKTVRMIVEWQRVGFVHGVMNTDNMSILGLTIDYGPFGWVENFDPNWTPNTTDAQGRRYRFGHQPQIAMWNLVQLANALYPLIEDVPALENILKSGQSELQKALRRMNLSKLGIQQNHNEDKGIVEKCMELMQRTEVDMTIFYRLVANCKRNNTPIDNFKMIEYAFYDIDALHEKQKREWLDWFELYGSFLTDSSHSDDERKAHMNLVNPKFVLRNYMAQLAIDKAEKGDFSLIDDLYELLLKPYDEQAEHEKWFAKRPEWAKNKVGCSMLSCSS